MKKLWNLAFGYFLAAMAGGVFYREFTKYFWIYGGNRTWLSACTFVGTWDGVVFISGACRQKYRSVGEEAVPYFCDSV